MSLASIPRLDSDGPYEEETRVSRAFKFEDACCKAKNDRSGPPFADMDEFNVEPAAAPSAIIFSVNSFVRRTRLSSPYNNLPAAFTILCPFPTFDERV